MGARKLEDKSFTPKIGDILTDIYGINRYIISAEESSDSFWIYDNQTKQKNPVLKERIPKIFSKRGCRRI